MFLNPRPSTDACRLIVKQDKTSFSEGSRFFERNESKGSAIWLSPKRLFRYRGYGIGSYSKIPICVSFWIWLALVGMNFYGVSVILEVNSTLLKILQIYVKTVRINCS